MDCVLLTGCLRSAASLPSVCTLPLSFRRTLIRSIRRSVSSGTNCLPFNLENCSISPVSFQHLASKSKPQKRSEAFSRLSSSISSFSCFQISKMHESVMIQRQKRLFSTASDEPKPQAETPLAPSTSSSPSSLRSRIGAYLRLARADKPVGTYLLLWPCFWSMGLATTHALTSSASSPILTSYWDVLSSATPSLTTMALFGIGAFVMRGAGCTVNDMWDSEYDKKVERTRTRPIASGEVTHRQAFAFLIAQLAAGLGVLVNLNFYTIALGCASIAPVILYPLAKRYIPIPQLVLGLTFNWGAMMGYSALAGACDWTICLPLYAGCILWTLHYDTIYAHQDKEDDTKIGIKSSALFFAERTKQYCAAFSVASTALLGAAGMAAGQSWPYYLGLGIGGAHLARQIKAVNLNNPASCGKTFVSNIHYGTIIFSAILAGNLWTAYELMQTVAA